MGLIETHGRAAQFPRRSRAGESKGFMLRAYEKTIWFV
jgi:hypothetical protein